MKKHISLFMIASLLFILAACGGQTAKETYTEAYQNLLDATSYEVTSTINLDLTAEHAANDPKLQMILDLLNNAEITADSRVDIEKEISELVLHVNTSQGPFSFDLDIPLHMNMKDQKVYVKTETLQQAMTMIPMMPLPAAELTFEKEFLALDASSDWNMEEQKELQQQFREQMNEFLNESTEDSFQETKDEIELNLTGEQIKPFITSFVEIALTQNGDMLEDTEKQEFEKALEEITFNHLTITTQIDGSQIKSEHVSLDLEADEGEENVNIALAITNEYTTINEEIEFTMEPTEESTMTQQELEAQFNQMMMESMMQPQ